MLVILVETQDIKDVWKKYDLCIHLFCYRRSHPARYCYSLYEIHLATL